MVSPAKGTFMRVVLPKNSAANILPLLGPTGRVQLKEKALLAGRLTTEQIVQYIREYERLRDELFHAMRSLGILREPREKPQDEEDHKVLASGSWKKLEEVKSESRESQSRIDKLGQEIEGLKKQIDRIQELIETGFGPGEITLESGGFTKTVGRIPTRRLEAAQRSIQSNLKDQAIIALGDRKDDHTYLLLATPREKASQALQILALYEFVRAELPQIDQPDPRTTLSLLLRERELLTKELGEEREKTKAFFLEASEELNRQADKVQEVSLLLKAVLKMGEGSSVIQAFVRLENPPSQKVLESLARQGTVVEIE